MSLTIDRPCKVGETEGFGLRIRNWLEGDETITAHSASNEDGLLTIQNTELDESGPDPVIKILAKGVKSGLAKVVFDYEAGPRTDCKTVNIYVNDR